MMTVHYDQCTYVLRCCTILVQNTQYTYIFAQIEYTVTPDP